MSEKHSKYTVAVDLDGVLAKYEGWQGVEIIGEPHEGAQGFIQSLLDAGFIVEVFTTRLNPDAQSADDCGQGHLVVGGDDRRWCDKLHTIVCNWLDQNGFPHRSQDFNVYAGRGKPVALAYIDDKSIMCEPAKHDDAYAAAIADCMSFRALAQTGKHPQITAEEIAIEMLGKMSEDPGAVTIIRGTLNGLQMVKSLADSFELAQKRALTDEEVRAAIGILSSITSHVASCDGKVASLKIDLYMHQKFIAEVDKSLVVAGDNYEISKEVYDKAAALIPMLRRLKAKTFTIGKAPTASQDASGDANDPGAAPEPAEVPAMESGVAERGENAAE